MNVQNNAMDSKTRLKEIVDNSALEPTLKSVWEIFLEVSSPKQNDIIVGVLEKNIKHLVFLSENICDKLWAMKTWDRKRMSAIIEQEKDYLAG